jgi:hypothetical protein
MAVKNSSTGTRLKHPLASKNNPTLSVIFSCRNWNRFWNREPGSAGAVGDFGEKTLMKSMVWVTGF